MISTLSFSRSINCHSHNRIWCWANWMNNRLQNWRRNRMLRRWRNSMNVRERSATSTCTICIVSSNLVCARVNSEIFLKRSSIFIMSLHSTIYCTGKMYYSPLPISTCQRNVGTRLLKFMKSWKRLADSKERVLNITRSLAMHCRKERNMQKLSRLTWKQTRWNRIISGTIAIWLFVIGWTEITR